MEDENKPEIPVTPETPVIVTDPEPTSPEPDQPETPQIPQTPQDNTPDLEEIKTVTKELLEANKEKATLLDREEKLLAEKERIGRGQIIPKTTPAPVSDRDYWNKLKTGELPHTEKPQ